MFKQIVQDGLDQCLLNLNLIWPIQKKDSHLARTQGEQSKPKIIVKNTID